MVYNLEYAPKYTTFSRFLLAGYAMRVLLIDDDETIQAILRHMLTSLGYEVDVANDAAEGLVLYQKFRHPLLLIDVMLPDTDGLELCRKIRDMPHGNESVLLVITAYSETENLQHALDAGADDYLAKPFDRKLLKIRLTIAENRLQDRLKRTQVEYQLRESEAMWRSLVESAPNFIVTINRDYCITFVNRMQPGLKREDFIGKNALSDHMAASEEIPRLKEIYDRAFTTGKIEQFEFRGTTGPHGKIGWYECNVGPIYRCGEVESLILIVGDITRRKQSEQERHQLEAQLYHAQKMEAIGTLAGGVAHDFNNLLVPIIGFSNMLRNRLEPNSKEVEYLEKILKAGKRAKGLVDQILVFSRKADIKRHPLSMNLVVEEVAELLQENLPTNIAMQLDLSDTTFPVLADQSQMHQIVMNLCTNARDAMPNGGELWMRLENIQNIEEHSITASLPSTDYIHLSVQDSGSGMDASTQERIFDPFFTTKELRKGTGLGLSLVLSIVEQHGGFMEVESVLHRGSTFHVYLPALQSQPASPLLTPSAQLIRGQESILFVDDEEMICELSSMLLQELGYRVQAVRSCLQALELFQSNPTGFDLVITDYTMPQMTGLKLAEAMRRLRADVPIILSTGHQERITERDIQQFHFSGMLQKPYEAEKLGVLIRNVLDRND